MAATERTEARLDEELVIEFQRGAVGAFDELYRTHRGRVTAIARRYLNDRRDVEEAVQDTFIKAFKALPHFNGNFRTSAWLARIAVNTAIDISRRNSRRPQPSLLDDQEGPPLPGLDELVVGSGADVDAALDRIPVSQALALRLRALHGASHDEIAARLGGTPSQAKALLHRARRSFKAVWREAGSGAAFAVTAGAVGLWVRLTRSSAAATQAAAGVQGASAGSGESLAAPVAALMERF